MIPFAPLLLALLVHAPQDPKPDPVMPPDAGGVTTTPSGLVYSVLAAGSGERPKPGDRVKVHYSGWFPDGKLFDSSVKRGKPFEFLLGASQVIEGWDEGVALMERGARWRLTIPPGLAYGDAPRGSIPASSTLVFEVELLEFKPEKTLPRFRAGNAAAQKKTESGIVYEPIREGQGELLEKDDVFELGYACWNARGVLVDCSESGQLKRGRVADMDLGFFKEAPLLLRPGARYRFEVPPALVYGTRNLGPKLPPNSTTIWELELVRIVPAPAVPAFVKPDETKLVKTASGLAYEVLREGTGAQPGPAQTVTVHYAGWLTDGKPFDSSYGRGEPMSFPLNRVIKGWIEGLQLMKEGAMYRFVVPAELGYGARGSPPTIPPNSTLVFQVELIKVGR